jgi:hypothetical protein
LFDNLCYHPILIQLPAGQGRQLKTTLAEALQQIRESLPARLDSDTFLKKRREAREVFRKDRAALVTEMEAVAGERGFGVDAEEPGALSLFPVVEGRRLNDEEVAALDAEQRREYKRMGDLVLQSLGPLVRRLSRLEKDFQKNEKELERDTVRELLDKYVTPVQEKACRCAGCGEGTGEREGRPGRLVRLVLQRAGRARPA